MSFILFFVQRKNWLILLFTLAYLAAFTVEAFTNRNYEFLYYTVLMAGLIVLTIAITRQLHLAFFILTNLSILGFLHLLGGTYHVQGVRLYDTYFVFGLLRYDNIVHMYGSLIVTIALYSLLADFIDGRLRDRFLILSLLLVLMTNGVGTFNELVELFAVIHFGAAKAVGDYLNNAFDLLFNTCGALLGCVVIYFYHEQPRLYRQMQNKLEAHRQR